MATFSRNLALCAVAGCLAFMSAGLPGDEDPTIAPAEPGLEQTPADAVPTDATASVAATAVNVQGDVRVQDGDAWDAVEEGQLFAQGDHLRTADDSTVHLVLADGSSVALAPNSEITLDKLSAGGEGSVTLLTLARGLLNTMVEKLKSGSSFEVQTPSAVAAVKGTDFEVSENNGESAVTVNDGVVQMGDAGRSHFEPVHPNERRRFAGHRLLAAETLSLAERNAFHSRWANAHRLHAQRAMLMGRLRRMPGRRAQFLRQLRRRNAVRGARMGRGFSGAMRPGQRHMGQGRPGPGPMGQGHLGQGRPGQKPGAGMPGHAKRRPARKGKLPERKRN
jgi:hypothetical protein